MEEEMVIDGYNVVVYWEGGYHYLSTVNGIEVNHLSDFFVLYIEEAALDVVRKEAAESRAERKINQFEDKQFFNM